MHYYQFHIGDYRAATAHLTNDEDLAYRRLLDMYYDMETPIPLNINWVSRRIKLDPDVVQNVLNDMFTLSEDGWVHSRCDSEIKKYHSKADSARKANQIRWESEKNLKSDADQILTNNHKPITNKKEIKTMTLERPDDVSEELWIEFKQHRKSKKAPITERVLKSLRSEAEKANLTLSQAMEKMMVKGWTGFEAAWIKPNETKPAASSALPDWAISRRTI
jgi:uncharacterized protein YdaU (DUF1376 family)